MTKDIIETAKNLKKKILLLFPVLLISIQLIGQIPAGYYDSANGLTGIPLKSALNDIISGHTVYPYTSTGTDVWDILKESDRDPNNSANVILLYTGWSVNAAQEYNSGAGWTREHCWAKSHGFDDMAQPAYTDCHHLRPCDVSVNSARNSRWYGECNKQYFDDGGTVPTDSWTSSTEWVWKPRDEVKGDCARMIFYMATRYEGEWNATAGVNEPDLEAIDYLPADDNSKLPELAKLSDLLLWNEQDPVNDFERNRNEVVYGYQGNRNPFIDHPEWVCEIFTSTCETPTTQAGNVTFSNVTPSSFTISWNQGNGDESLVLINSSNSYTNPTDGNDPTANSTYSSGEQVVFNGLENTINIDGLSPNTTYFVWVFEKNCTGLNAIYQTISPASNVMLTPNGTDGGGSEEIIAYQGFESGDTWNYTSNPGTATIATTTEKVNSGTNSLKLTGSTENADGNIVLDNVDISSYNTVKLSLAFASKGVDSDDDLYLDISYDNGLTWNGNGSVKLIDGYNNGEIEFGTTNASNPTTVSTNPWIVSVDDAETQIKVRVKFDEKSGTSTSDYYYVDDIKLLFTTNNSYTSKDTDYFRTCTDGTFSTTSIWQSSDDNSSWYTSSLVPDQNAVCVIISDNDSITYSSDITVKDFILNPSSSFEFSADNLTLAVQNDLTINASATLDLSRTGTLLKLNGSVLQTISGVGTISLYNIEIDNTNNVTLSKDITVANQITLTNGLLNTGENTITIDNATTTSISGYSTSNYINGVLKRKVNATGVYVFPIGTGSNYEFAQIDLNSSSEINYLTASFSSLITGNAPSLTTNGVNINTLLDAGIWTIFPDAVSSVNYDATLVSRGHTNGAIAVDRHTLLKRDNNLDDWALSGIASIVDQTGTGTDPITIKRNGLTGFSDFGVGVGDGSLPIELVDFNVNSNIIISRNVLILSNSQNNIKEITIYNLYGQKVSKLNGNSFTNNQFDLNYLENGLYFIHIVTNLGHTTEKVVIYN
ncbi:MAG: endonuclease [Bacteroidetes bacterium]|nr:endonuclease [Bacteroidota bacterium]